MTNTHVSDESGHDQGEAVDDTEFAHLLERDEVRRFRATSYEDAVRAATDELGADLRVLAANRIRRGGIGGFFATDLGVEVAVLPTGSASDAPTTAMARTTFDNSAEPDLVDRDRPPIELSGDRLQQLLAQAEQRDREFASGRFVEAGTFAEHLQRASRSTADGAPDRSGEFTGDAPSCASDRSGVLAGSDPSRPLSAPTQPDDPTRPAGTAAASAPSSMMPADTSVVGDPLLGVAPAPAARSTTSARASRRRSAEKDPLRRPTQLAAAATDRLITKLGKVAPVEGSRLHGLRRVRVAVTTSDGTQIEMTADLDG